VTRSNTQKWKAQDTSNGWTLQNAHNQKYLDYDKGPESESKPVNGTKVVAVETNSPRSWDIRPDQSDANASFSSATPTSTSIFPTTAMPTQAPVGRSDNCWAVVRLEEIEIDRRLTAILGANTPWLK